MPQREIKERIKKSFLYRSLKRTLYYPLAIMIYVCGIRFIQVTTPDRIGHLCIEPDSFIKEGILGLRSKFIGVLLLPRKVVANTVVLDLWRRCIPVVTSTLACQLLSPLTGFSFIRYSVEHYVIAIGETAASAAILAKWNDRPPLLKKEWVASTDGWEVLRKLGIPPGSWYVCVHSRDGHYSLTDEHLHSYRNSSIENYRLAMQEIVEHGGWCVRVGEPTPVTMPPMPGVVDYANSTAKSDWMDVFLCAHCRFFLGNSSGLSLLATVFGVPSALANLVPVSGALPIGRGDLGIPKTLRSRKTGHLLSYREVLESPVANFRYGSQYVEADIEVEENSPEDIRDLSNEMLAKLSGTASSDSSDERLQERFQRMMRPGHYSFGADSRIGRDFLRKYAELL